MAWAKSHLKAAGLLENPVRGRVRISDLGRKVLAENPPAINARFLKRFPAYCEFIGKSAPTHDEGVSERDNTSRRATDPSGTDRRLLQIASAGDGRGSAVQLKACSPPFFESVVVRLLMAMGYGGVAGMDRSRARRVMAASTG